MKKWMLVFTAVVALAGGTLMAAGIGNLSGQSCGADIGTWHFIHNQTGGAAQGTLTATWSSGDTCTVGAYKVLASTQHYLCTASGELTNASDNIAAGKLVLSDFSCQDVKCDPKTDPNGCK
jgi:hypothetical protein